MSALRMNFTKAVFIAGLLYLIVLDSCFIIIISYDDLFFEKSCRLVVILQQICLVSFLLLGNIKILS